ncbi:C-terminal binding protein [Kineococcus sp. SYSU DK003]|uniref:C-terminal binding protein n=1 Tax=Kineococcus sp. SYSU DK003 TaxID=3383124 RepID=UPI003D7DF81D
MSTTVLVTDNDSGPATIERGVLEPAGHRVVEAACRTEADVVAAVTEHRPAGLLVQYAPMTREVLRTCADLGVRALFRYGVGMDNVDEAAAWEAGVVARNVPDYGSAEVADHAVTLLLSLLRAVPTWSAATAGGNWPARGELRDPAELRVTTVGLVGFGAIAREVARRLLPFGCTVVVADPFVAAQDAAAHGVELVDLPDLFARADALSVHAPLTEQTRGVVGADAFARMRPGTLLVNTARAGLVDRGALEAALADGTIAGAALDVWWTEPAAPDDPLLRDPRVVVTPHVAWLSPGSAHRLRRLAAERLLEVLTQA